MKSRTPTYSAMRLGALSGLAVLIALLTLASARTPHLPGDVAIARAIQRIAPVSTASAQWITATAEVPWCFVLLALTAIAAWAIDGWRPAILAVPVFFGLWIFGMLLSPAVAQPRPSPTLINVVGHPKGYAFPSLFGLIYAATFGYIGLLASRRAQGTSALVIPALAVLTLIIGACARVVLGAHWPSDLWVAYLMGLFWIEFLVPPSGADAG